MTDKKFTDEEIKKALDCCAIDYCNDCPLANEDIEEIGCDVNIHFLALDLVNRLKKYDEERDIRLHARLIATARAEAIKEFAERLKEYSKCYSYVTPRDIDNLVKEMVGED